jgi:hypothetical protein
MKPEEQQGGRLKFDPTINAGHLLTFAGFLITISVGWSTLDKRVVVLEEQRRSQDQRDQAQDARSSEKFGEIRETMQDIKRTVEIVRDKLEKRQ